MRIFDAFMFRDELDMLECRLVQMEDSPVYRHILVEARVNHQGRPKPLFYADNQERFAPWKDRIIHVIADGLPTVAENPDPWSREGAQREATGRGLADAASDDWLILADVDEIPSDVAMKAAADRVTGVYEMKLCPFAVDWEWDWLRASPIMAVGAVPRYGSFAQARRGGWCAGPVIPFAGHHLTWMGGAERVRGKLASHCHTEANDAITAVLEDDAFIRLGANPFGAYGYDGKLHPVDVDETWPRWVAERRCPPDWFRPR